MIENNKYITVLSLFDGMSCGQIALKELGIKVNKYYASEIDKFAIQQTQHNFPDTIQLGDITKWKEWDIDFSSIDLVLAGSPCQGFSFAGKQLAFDDPRSKLFFVFVDILKYIKALNPDVKFLLENVNMKRSHMEVITRYIGVFPVNINSNLVSAQNRNRWYWTNIATKEVGLFGEIHSDIKQPKDKGLILKDILENEVDEKYYLSDKIINGFLNKKSIFRERFNPVTGNMKAGCLTSRCYKMSSTDTYIRVSNRIRRLTPTECSRLQTVPEWYEWVVSDTQIYKMCGNGWTVDVIISILSFMFIEIKIKNKTI